MPPPGRSSGYRKVCATCSIDDFRADSPTARGRTYEELDVLFDRKVPARKFAGYELDVYESELTEMRKNGHD